MPDGGRNLIGNGFGQLSLTGRMTVWLLMVNIDDADKLSFKDNGHGKKSFKPVLRQPLERLKPGIFTGLPRNSNNFALFSHPSGDTFAQFKPDPSDLFTM